MRFFLSGSEFVSVFRSWRQKKKIPTQRRTETHCSINFFPFFKHLSNQSCTCSSVARHSRGIMHTGRTLFSNWAAGHPQKQGVGYAARKKETTTACTYPVNRPNSPPPPKRSSKFSRIKHEGAKRDRYIRGCGGRQL